MITKTKILIIEPDLLLAKIYREYLERFDLTVDICGGGQAAINLIDQNKPDLIILEMQLTAHNGFEFLYELRSYPEWQDIPVLIHSVIHPAKIGISSDARDQLGVIDVLYKPSCSLANLLYKVSSYSLVK